MDRCRFLVLLGALLAASPAGAARSDVLAIVGARLVTVSGPVLESATLVLRDGVIEAVGPAAAVPPDARVIDGKGLVLTPGIIDGFGGLGLPPPTARAAGVPPAAAASPTAPPLAPQAMALDRLRPADVVKARDSGITTALVVPKEGVLPGQSVLVNLSGEKADAMVLRQPAALHLHMATLSRQYPGSLMGTVAYVRQALYDAARYRDQWTSYERAPAGTKRPRYDAALAAWQEVAAGREPLVVTASRENDLRRALLLADEFHLRVVLAGAPQAARLAPLLKQRKVPLLVGVNFDPARVVTGGPAGFGGRSEEQEQRDIDEAERNPAALLEAGVPFALVSAHAPDFLAGVRRAIERGLPREAALRAVTLAAAEALGIADRLGSLEAGKIANVVAWSGEPLAKDAKVRMVFVDGRLYEPEERKDGPERKGESKPAAEPSPLPPLPPAADESPAPPLAIVGGTLLTAGPLGTIENGTVLVRGGKIVAVGPDVTVPAGTTVLDAKGRYLIPGIIDTHSHNAIEGGVNECTDSVTAEVRIADVIDHRAVDIYRQLAGGVTTLNVLHGSCNTIGGQNAVIKLRWGRGPRELLFEGAPRGIKFALGENVKRSNFRAPGVPPRYPGTRMGVENVLRESFQEARAYKREWEDYERRAKGAGGRPVPPRRDLRLETLRDVLDGKVYVHAHGYRADEILMLLRVADEFGFKIRTVQHGLEAYKVASEIARHGAGVGTFIDWWAYKLEAYNATPYNPAILFRKGVTVSLNSDSNELARRLYWDAAKAVKYGGVPEAEALKMITLNGAKQLGIDRRVGSIEVGKDADLAVFSAHPFSPEAVCETTLVDGTVFFDRAKDLAWRATRDDLKAGAGGGR